MIPLNNLSSRTKYEKNDFLNLTSPLIPVTNEEQYLIFGKQALQSKLYE